MEKSPSGPVCQSSSPTQCSSRSTLSFFPWRSMPALSTSILPAANGAGLPRAYTARTSPLRSPLLTSVAVVLRAKQHAHPPLQDVARLIERFMDHSVYWSVLLAVQQELPHLLRHLIATNCEIGAEKLGIAMQTAAKKGDLGALQCLHAYQPQVEIPRAVMDQAAEKNHLHVAQWLHSNGARCSEKALEQAARHGHLGMVQWLYEHKYETSSRAGRAMPMAGQGGHVAILQFLDAQAHETSDMSVAKAAVLFGHIPVLQYVLERHPDEFRRDELLQIASRCKRRNVVVWLKALPY